jgi:hypothetical protein
MQQSWTELARLFVRDKQQLSGIMPWQRHRGRRLSSTHAPNFDPARHAAPRIQVVADLLPLE